VRLKLIITGKDSIISSSSISSADSGKTHIPRPEENKHRHIILYNNEKIWIPPSQDIFIKDYLREMRTFLKPEYPLPCEIIYKIYIDDGHCAVGHQGYKPSNPSPFVTFNCKFHENPELIKNKNDS
jgi:hypothetical protein